MTSVLLDTDVIIDFFNGIEPSTTKLRRLLTDRSALLSTITIFELNAGVVGKRRKEQIALFSEVLPVTPFTREMAEIAADIYTTLKAQGALIGNGDILLGATCLALGTTLLTRNRAHFERIDGLTLEPL